MLAADTGTWIARTRDRHRARVTRAEPHRRSSRDQHTLWPRRTTELHGSLECTTPLQPRSHSRSLLSHRRWYMLCARSAVVALTRVDMIGCVIDQG